MIMPLDQITKPRLAAILAGGAGSRLRPSLGERPKCLAEINGLPFIVYQLRQLRHFGFTRVLMLTGQGHDDVAAYLGDGETFGVEVSYHRESEPMGTAGAVREARDQLGERFLLLNGDTLADCDLAALYGAHGDAAATIAVTEVQSPGDFGRVRIDGDQRVLAFDEKPADGRAAYVSAGVYCAGPDICDYIPGQGAVSLELDVFPALLREQASVFAHSCDGFFDIGTPERLDEAQRHPYFQAATDKWPFTAAKRPSE
jgi:NDP-sugar pyrophosphorylase family protein